MGGPEPGVPAHGSEPVDQLSGGSDEPPRRGHLAGLGVTAVAALAATAIALAGPDLSLHAEQPAGEPSSPSASGPPPPSSLRLADLPTATFGPVTWSLRGGLARDEAFVVAATARIRQRHPAAAPFFAGRLPDGSRLLLAGAETGTRTPSTSAVRLHAVLVGPGDAVPAGRVTRMRVSESPGYPPWFLTWAGRASDGHAYAVSLTAELRATFETSPNVLFRDDGSSYRQWVRKVAPEGWAVTDLGARPDLFIGIRREAEGYPSHTGGTWLDGEPSRTPVVLEGLTDPGYEGPRPRVLASGVRFQLRALAGTDVLRGRVVWSGSVRGDEPAALVVVTRPDGVRLAALVEQHRGSPVLFGTRALPVDGPATIPWLLEPNPGRGPTRLICPGRPATITYRPKHGAARSISVPPSGVVELEGAGAGRRRARGATVVERDRRGERTRTTVLTPSEPYGLLGTDL